MSQPIHGPQPGTPEIPLPSDRSTGLVFAAVALVVAWFWRANPAVVPWALGSAAVLAAVSFLSPRVLRPLNIVWFRIGQLVHKVMNPVVMLALFAISIVPAGLIMQLLRDPLRLKQPQDASYWIKVDKQLQGRTTMKNQF
jgi:hypothetical protein